MSAMKEPKRRRKNSGNSEAIMG